MSVILNDNMIMEILKCKSESISKRELCNVFKTKYNIDLKVSEITRIYTGKIVPNIVDEDYNELVTTKTTKRKITDEDIVFIKNLYNTYLKDNIKLSYEKIANDFKEKFNKKIQKSTISNIINNKIKPLNTKIVLEQPILMPKCNNVNKKFNLLSKDKLFNIIKMKSQKKTTQEVSDYVKENYNIYINRNYISKLWLGEVVLDSSITDTIEYKEMLENKKKRSTSLKKFTEIEIEWLKNEYKKETYSLLELSELFKKKFNKTITKTYITYITKITQTI